MRAYLPILILLALLAAIPLVVTSNTALNFVVFVLIIALAAQGWNVLGGVGGSPRRPCCLLRHRAYVSAILQSRYG